MDCNVQGFPIHHQLSEITQTHVHCLGDAIQPPHPLSTLSVFNLTQHQGIFFFFISESVLHIWCPKFGAEASASVLPINIQDSLPLGLTGLAVQGTLRSVLKHHSSKASVLWHSAIFMVPILTSMHAYWKNNSID